MIIFQEETKFSITYFVCSRIDGGPVFSEIELQFSKLSVRSVDVQEKPFEKLFSKPQQPLAVHPKH